MDLYASALKREENKQAKQAKKASAKRAVASRSESSNSEESVNNLEGPIPRKKKARKTFLTPEKGSDSEKESVAPRKRSKRYLELVKKINERKAKQVVDMTSGSDSEEDNAQVEEDAFLLAIDKEEAKQKKAAQKYATSNSLAEESS